MMNSLWRDRTGLTLLELLVAVVVFTLGVLIAGRFIVEFTHQIGVSEARAQATEFAIAQMERLKLMPYDAIAPVAPEPVPDAPKFTRRVEVREVGGGPTDVYTFRLVTVIVDPPSQVAPPVQVTTAVAP